MTMHDGIVEQSGRFKKAVASKDTSSYKVVKKNQLVVGFPIDEGVIYVQNHERAGIMSPAYNVWDFDSSRIAPAYLELALHSPQSMAYYAEKLRGTTARRRSLTADGLRALPIVLPSIERQGAVVEVLKGIKGQIADARKTANELDHLVKSDFIGHIRLKHIKRRVRMSCVDNSAHRRIAIMAKWFDADVAELREAFRLPLLFSHRSIFRHTCKNWRQTHKATARNVHIPRDSEKR